MVDKPTKCPKCDDLMEEGGPSHLGFGWATMPWEGSWLKRFTAAARGAKRVRGLRCKGCGYLELYTKL